MEPSRAWSFAFGAIGYVLFLGVGVACLVVYNIYNNRTLRKARQKEEDERWRDSVLDDRDAKELGTFARSPERPSSLAISLATRVESPGRHSRSSFSDDTISIDEEKKDTRLSLSTTLSAGSHDSIAGERPSELNALAVGHQDGDRSASTRYSLGSVYSFSDSCLH